MSMGTTIFTSKKDKKVSKYFSTPKDDITEVVTDLETGKILEVKSTFMPPLELPKSKGGLAIKVSVSSAESTNKELLHHLHTVSR